MAYNPSRHLVALSDKHGGVRLRARDRFLPGRARDAAATKKTTLYTHHIVEGERLELEDRDNGAVALVLISPTAEVVMPPPKGASGMTDARLRQQNADAKAFWAGRGVPKAGAPSSEAEELRRQNDRARRFWNI